MMDDELPDPERVHLVATCIVDVFRVLNATQREALCAMAVVAKAMADYNEITSMDEEQPQWH
jgi:hypothetical protein